MKPLCLLAVLLLTAAAAGVSGGAAEARDGGRWPGRTITYSEKLPPSYDWVVASAVRAWNEGSGARIRLVEAPAGKRGQVRISLAPTPGHGGQATQGRHPHAYVHLSDNLPRKLKRPDWITTGALLAHELGHVLGLGHDSDQGCDLMDVYLCVGSYGLSARPGYMSCRWVTRKDARRATRLYGGRVHLRPKQCPVEPASPQLRDRRISGGFSDGRPVSLSWSVPPGLPSGSRIEVNVYLQGRCGDASGLVEQHVLRATTTGWTDSAGAERTVAPYCYELQVRNYWGLPAEPVLRETRQNWSPAPWAPVLVGRSPSDFEEDAYVYSLDADDDASVFARVAPSGSCVTSLDEEAIYVGFGGSADPYYLSGVPHGSCVTFWAVSNHNAPSSSLTDRVP